MWCVGSGRLCRTLRSRTQGLFRGCSVENIRPTGYEQPVYARHGVLHQAVPNMPGAEAKTASQALSAVVLPYVTELLEKGTSGSELKEAVAAHDGAVVDPVLKQELGL